MNKSLLTIAIASGCLLVSGANALTINDPGVVGIIDTGADSADVTTVTPYANYLLSLGASESQTVSGVYYATSSTDYNGTLTGGTRVDGATPDVSSFLWVLGKYNGKNAGYVLFYIPDVGGSSIPEYSDSIWTNAAGKGYQLSNITGYGTRTSIPDGGMTLTLFGASLLGLFGAARRFAKQS